MSIVLNLSYVCHPDECGGYWGSLTEFPDCCTSGSTLEELHENMLDLAESVLFDRIDGELVLAESILDNPEFYEKAERMIFPRWQIEKFMSERAYEVPEQEPVRTAA